MPIEVTASDVPITVSASGTKIDAAVSGGQGPVGPQGPAGSTSPDDITTTTTYANFLPTGGSLATAYSGIDSAISGKLSSSDASVTNSREWSADTVSQAEAEAGTATTRRAWTAQRVFQAIAAWWATVTVGTSKIDDGAVTSAKVAAGAVTPSKLAIGSSQIWGVWGTLSVGAGDFQVHSAAPGFGLTRFRVSNSTGTVSAANGQFIINSTGDVTAGQWQGTAVAVAYGGTGATTAADARTNLGAAALSHAHGVGDIQVGTATAGQVLTVNSGATALVWATPTTYSLPVATSSVLGGVKQGSNVTIDGSGVISVAAPFSGAYGDLTGKPTLGTAAALNTGTTAGTVATGDHTHTQLHDRSHAITSSSDHTATAWRLFYSNGSGVITELTLGSSGQALLSNGASAAPSWGSAGSNSASDLTTGTLAAARIGAHASTHQTGGTDAVTNVVVSPSQITGNQNDYSPGTGDIVRLSSDAARNITGITAGNSGDVRVLVNVGSFTITLVHQSASSTAANRFLVSFGADYLLASNAAAVIVYDATASRWRVI